MDEKLAETCFRIIAEVGLARSNFIDAIEAIKHGDETEAQRLTKEGEEHFHTGHRMHSELIQKEANGEGVAMNLFLVHAEDILMSAEAFKIISQQFMDLYKEIRQ
ncbi:MAG: PTS lactose/cellobiose transporter subunit IIA [Merdibacter sp.]